MPLPCRRTWRCATPRSTRPCCRTVCSSPWARCCRACAADNRGRWRGPAAVLFLAGSLVEIAFHAGSMRDNPLIDPNPTAPILVFVAAIAAIASADRLQGPLARLGPARLATLGLVTYPLYLLHQTVGAALIAALMATGLSGWAAIVLAALGVIALAFAVTRWCEPWVRRWLARVSAPRDPAPDSRPTASLPTG
ncbi:acyltransferase family protein [Sphingomonas panacisoli]|uniref:acyltransferase family protein n=1 Tax=Sphingomonas panacisoli TaxID=1813879 RepID=UPI003B846B5D